MSASTTHPQSHPHVAPRGTDPSPAAAQKNTETSAKTGDAGSKLAGALPTLLTLVVLAIGWIAINRLIHGHTPASEEAVSEAVIEEDFLQLPEGKLAAAQFQTEPARERPMTHIHTVPGRLTYDETKHVDVKAPLDGILDDILVTPGESIEAGQLIAIISSPEIGRARSQVVKCRKDIEIASGVLERENALMNNLQSLFAMLEKKQPVDAIEEHFSDKALGGYRQEILASYAKLQLAEESYRKIEPLVSSGSVSGKTARERRTDVQIAENAFRTASDQAAFAAKQSQLKAEAELAEADRQLSLALRAVETLLGFQGDTVVPPAVEEEGLSRLEVRAPFAGTVELVEFADDERVSSGDALIVLANTDSLYVSASIRESDWPAVMLKAGTVIEVVVPALKKTYPATIRYIGRQVDLQTNSVPLVAAIDNTDGMLRPGMFVRVSIPVGEQRQALAIKPESLLQHEDQQFVFIQTDGNKFKRVDVSVGDTSENWIEVTEGLTPGQLVVTDGAFLLKSELLLQGE